MDKKQADHYNMFRTIETHFEEYPAIWESDILISEAKAALSAKINQMMTVAAKQAHTSVGITKYKAERRTDLEAKVFSLSAAVCAYITVNPEHSELYKTVYITHRGLSKLREADLLLYIENLQEATLTVLDNLAPYRVTQDTLTALTAARTAFFEVMKTPKEIIAARREATAAISVLQHQASTVLKMSMDRLVLVLRDSDPQFVDMYFNERRIHHMGTRHMSLEITTLNAADKSPLAEAKIEVVDKKIKRTSSKKGKNRVQNLKEGNYTLSVSRENYVPQLVPFTIMNHQTTQLVVELKQVAEEQRFKDAERS